MSSARDRRERRKQRESMVSRPTTNTRPTQTMPLNAPQLPQFKLPFNRVLLLIPLAIALLVGVIFALGLLNPPDVVTPPNAIWLDSAWTYNPPSDEELNALVSTLREHRIGRVFAFASSLKPDNTWSGITTQSNRWNNEAEPLVAGFVDRLRIAYPEAQIFAWVEVLAELPNGYRLDSAGVQRTVSEFSARLMNTLKFDGVLLDIKPIFDGNEDLLVLLRSVRGAIGLEAPLALAVPADLTPSGVSFALPSIIAPNTVWSEQYKQRVSLQADVLVVTAYNSYQTSPVDYIFWVSYQVESFTKALEAITAQSDLLISVPNYAEFAPAHLPTVESMAGALDGVARARLDLPTAQVPYLTGVAIFTDKPLTPTDWQIFREKWLTLPASQ